VKSYRWLTLIAALLITLAKFWSSGARRPSPDEQANAAVAAGRDSRRHAPGVEPWRLVKPRTCGFGVLMNPLANGARRNAAS